MSLLDDDEDDAPAAPKSAPARGQSAEAPPEAVDGQSESPILPRFREQEEGV
jgi:hypothetical protein